MRGVGSGMRRAAWAAAVWGVVGAPAGRLPPAFAEPAPSPPGATAPAPGEKVDAEAVLDRVEKRLYHPADHGLKDLSAGVRADMLRDMGEGTVVQVRFYWKAPSRRRVRFEGLGDLPPEARRYVAIAEGQIRGLAFLAVREKFSAMREDAVFAAAAEGDLVRVVARRRPESKAAGRAEETVFWVDREDRVVRVASRTGATESEAKVTYVEKEGKLLQETLTVRAIRRDEQTPETVISFEHVRVGTWWLVSRIRYAVGEQTSFLEFEDWRVNEGVEDAVFEEEKFQRPNPKSK